MKPTILVTGATGYIGGRLIRELLDHGYHVRAMARRPEVLANRSWAASVDLVRADAENVDDLRRACEGVDCAYFLIHGMGDGPGFAERERTTASNFAQAAKEAGVSRIVYLSGLHPEGAPLSEHLASRVMVGEQLVASGVPTLVLQAAVIVGSGSAAFEMMRYLAERLPVMVAPRWINNRIQPIAVRDVMWYLRKALDVPANVSGVYDIGGPDILTYAEMIQIYAHVNGLKRRMVLAVPVLTPTLAGKWIGLVTPVPPAIAKPLIESVVHDVVCRDVSIHDYIPPPEGGLIAFSQAIRLALQRIRDGQVFTSFASALGRSSAAEPMPDDPSWAGGDVFVDERQSDVGATPADLWRVLEGIGGQSGWYSWRFAWEVRGLLDRVVGGPGLRRGRRNEEYLRVGDPVDWWRVEYIEPGHTLRLRAEMKLPGQAWLELSSSERPSGAEFRLRAIFEPRGLAGRAYWALVYPFHGIVFGGMCRNIALAAEQLSAMSDSVTTASVADG